MTKRERYLAIAVGVVVGLFVLQYGLNSVRSSLQAKQDAVDAARSDVEDMEKILTSGKLAARKLEQLAPKSLPTNPETLVNQYRNWLFELGETSGLKDINVGTPRSSSPTDAYTAYEFTLSGVARKDNIIDLLAKYYDRDYLQSIVRLNLTQTRVRDELNITIDSRVLALNNASAKQPPSLESSGRLAMGVDEYQSVILGRNPFSPPNQPPRFASSRRHEVVRGDRWSLDLEANDPEGQDVEFELVASENVPDGLKLERGAFSWEPKANGQFEFKVRAKDRGWPSKATEETFVVSVVDPPREEPKIEQPKFDVASQAFVSALLRGRGGPEVWIRSRTDGETLQLSEGAGFELGSVKAKVVGIHLDADYVELESEDGSRWTIGMNTSLAEAYRQRQID